MKRLLALALSLAVSLTAIPALADTSIRVDGSTTVLPIMQKMVEAYMSANPGVNITVSGGGSGNGIKAIIDGTTDVAMSSRDMKDKEVDTAKEKGRMVRPLVIAIDALVPMVHPSNPVKSLTVEQLRDIFAGKVTNWKDVGGEDKQIVVISRDTSSGTYEAWQELIMKDAKVFPGALLQASSGAVLQVVGKNKYAIGYDGYGYLNSTVKAVAVNNVPGNPETASNKTYPVARPLYIITSGEPAGEIAKFVAFIMDPAKGQKIVTESGAVAVKK